LHSNPAPFPVGIPFKARFRPALRFSRQGWLIVTVSRQKQKAIGVPVDEKEFRNREKWLFLP